MLPAEYSGKNYNIRDKRHHEPNVYHNARHKDHPAKQRNIQQRRHEHVVTRYTIEMETRTDITGVQEYTYTEIRKRHGIANASQ